MHSSKHHRQETYSSPDIDAASNRPLDIGEQLDPQGSPKKNEGFFENGLLKATENELGGREVKVVANGHSHRKYDGSSSFPNLTLAHSLKQLPPSTRNMVLLQWRVIL